MFNLSKKAQAKPSPEFTQQQAQHAERIKNRIQSLAEDARHFALRMYHEDLKNVQEVLDPTDSIPYWRYVRKFDPKYMKELARLIPEVLRDIRQNPNSYIPPTPPSPQKPPGGAPPGGGAGAPPPPGGAAPGTPMGAPPPAGGNLGAPTGPTAFNARRKKTASIDWEAFALDDGTVVVEKKPNQGK